MEEHRSSISVVGCGSSLDESAEIFHHFEQDVVPTWVEEQRSSISVVGCGSSLDESTGLFHHYGSMWFRPGWKNSGLPSLW